MTTQIIWTESNGGMTLQQIQGASAASATATGSSAGTAVVNAPIGKVTTTSLTTAAGADATLTITNNLVAATDMIFASVRYGSATTGVPMVAQVTPGTGSFTVVIQNIAASAALNGTLVVSFQQVPFG